MNRNDILWKGLIENLFPHFIPFFLPRYQHLFDTKKPVEFLDKELQSLYPETADLSNLRFVDKLVKMYTTDGSEKWVLIHIEVQGYHDKQFAERMYRYYYRILDRYSVPVTAIAIFTDNSKRFCPSRYDYSFAGTKSSYQFNTYKVLQQNEKLLEKSDNPFAIAILTVLLALRQKKLTDDYLLGLKVALVKQLLSRNFEATTIRSLFNFIRRYVNFARPETAFKFESEIELITQNRSTMGIEEIIIEMAKQEGRKEGKAEGKVEGKVEGRMEERMERNEIFVKNLLISSDFNDEKIASLADVPIAFVQGIKNNLIR